METLKAFADNAKLVASTMPQDARFGRHKVFLYPLYETLSKAHPGLTVEAFKDQMWRAHREGLLTLARADLTPAMDPFLVQSSEFPIMMGERPIATFHFLDIEG